MTRFPNFWLKELSCFHPHYARIFNTIINENIETPSWLTKGMTSLLPKSKDTMLPNKYRPICCLPTTYKLLTGMIADAIYEHLERWQYLEEEQKGCIRQRQGTKHQLLINKSILEDCKRRARNLSMAWVDYKKAYDIVCHIRGSSDVLTYTKSTQPSKNFSRPRCRNGQWISP